MRRPRAEAFVLATTLGLLTGPAWGFVVPVRPGVQLGGCMAQLQRQPSSCRLPEWRTAPVVAVRPAARRGALQMLKEPQGSDAFTRVVEKGASLGPLHKLPSTAAKVIKFTTIPLGAVGGFLAVPANAGLLRVCGGALGGILCKTLNDKLRGMRQDGAEVAVAQMLLEFSDDLQSLTPAALKATTARYDVEYANHLKIMSSFYTQYLLAMLDWPEVRMEEPQSLVDLSAALGLDSSTIGDAHVAAADEIAKRLSEVPIHEREDAWEKRMTNKLLFLSNRLFAELEEEETREYELNRVTEVLGLSTDEGAQRIQGLVLPYYTSIVKNGVTTLRTGSPSLDGPRLQKWRQSLGVSETQATRVNNDAFAVEVKRCLDAGNGRVRDGDMEFLTNARSLLSISSLEAEKVLESVTAPLLRQAIVDMLTSLMSTEPSTWPDALHKVRQRQKELKMVDSALVFHIKDVYRERLMGLVKQISEPVALGVTETHEDKDAREAKLRKVVGAALLLVRLMKQFIEVNSLEEVMDEDLSRLAFLNLLPGQFERHARENALRRYVEALISAKLVDEEVASIWELGSFLELSEMYVRNTLNGLVGPIYQERVRGFVASNALTDANKASLVELIKTFHVEDADVRSIGLSIYTEKANDLFKQHSRRYTDEDLRQLSTLRGFLLLSEADTDRIHEPLGRDEFRAAVEKEFGALKQGEPLSAEGRGRIMELGKRLALSEGAMDDLMGEAMTAYLEPVLKKLKDGYKRMVTPPAELAKKTGKDEGEDPFIKARSKDGLMIKTESNSNLMVDAVTIVQFLDDQDGFRTTTMTLDDENHMVKKTDGRPKRQVTSYISKAQTASLADDDDEDDKKLAEDMYKAFVQTVARAPEGEKKERYRVIQDKFGATLGLHPPRMEAIKFEMYAPQMKKLVRGCLETKGMLGADDNAELAKLNKDWAIDEERSARLVTAEKRRWLAGSLVSVITNPPSLVGPIVHKLRNAAASMGIDLSEDMPELTIGNRELLFTYELRWMLEEGPEDADSDIVKDMLDAYGVKQDPASAVIAREFKDVSRQACVDLLGNMNKGDYRGAFGDLQRLLRIGTLLPLPMDFGSEAFLGMAACAEIRRLWSSYAALLDQPGGQQLVDLSSLFAGRPQQQIAALKQSFARENEVINRLTSRLEALPATGAEVDLTIDYRGRKVKRKRITDEDMGSDAESWEEGKLELMDPKQAQVALNPDGSPRTIMDVLKEAVENRHEFMSVTKKKRQAPRKKGDKGDQPRNASGMRPH